MNRLNVLLVSYIFPPAGGVGVLRAASLARYLPTANIRLDVLTAKNASAVGSDPELLKEIPAEVVIHRTMTLDLPFALKKGIKKLITGGRGNAEERVKGANPRFLKKISQDLLLPDPQITWLPVLTRAARRIVSERQIELVLITVPPFSTVYLVERLRERFRELPIVIDFRDEWLSTTIDFVSFSRSERALRIARAAEASAVTKATAVIAVTEGARREIRARYPQEPECKFQLLPNGFDSSRLHKTVHSDEPRKDDRIVVTYLGSVYGSTDPTELIGAVLSLPYEVKSRFKLRFIGHIEEPRLRKNLLQLGEMIELTGFLPQGEALAKMSESDYALLITHDPLNVSAKFYDYIGSGKPILAVVHPKGEVQKLIEELQVGWWAANHDVEGIRQLFLDAAARGYPPFADFQPDIEKISQFERKVLARRYAGILHSIAGNRDAYEPLVAPAEAVRREG